MCRQFPVNANISKFLVIVTTLLDLFTDGFLFNSFNLIYFFADNATLLLVTTLPAILTAFRVLSAFSRSPYLNTCSPEDPINMLTSVL